MSSISVLMYHAIESAKHPAGVREAGEKRYVLQLDKFREQIEYLNQEGFKTFLLEELYNKCEKWPNKAVIITFDDGHESNFALALPILLQYGFKAEFFITTDWIGTPHYMAAAQIKTLSEAGMGIGSHGLSHKFLDDMKDTEIKRELSESRDVLVGITGRKVVSFSAPGGRLRNGVAAIAESLGYSMICTSKPGIFKQGMFAFSIPRLAINSGTVMETYKAMVLGCNRYINKLIRRNNLLLFAKKILGNKTYNKMRRILFMDI